MKVIRNECVHNHATVATVVSIGGFHTAQGGTEGGGRVRHLKAQEFSDN